MKLLHKKLSTENCFTSGTVNEQPWPMISAARLAKIKHIFRKSAAIFFIYTKIMIDGKMAGNVS